MRRSARRLRPNPLPRLPHEYLLAFSCRGRWFCPSCHAKKVVQFGELLRSNLLGPIPHRQYVFSIPKILRLYFRYDRKLLTRLCHCANRCLKRFFCTALGLPHGEFGAVMAIQTFGDYGRWHPHLHILLADGQFTANGLFHVMPGSDVQLLQELYRAAVLRILQREGTIDEELIRIIMRWRYTSGFSVHKGGQLARDNDNGQESPAQYILRNPFSVEKIHYQKQSGPVIYKSKMTHGKNRKNFEVFTAEEFIAAIIQHIPEKSFQLVRYYSWYSNRSRGERAKRECQSRTGHDVVGSGAAEVLHVVDHQPRKIPSPTWRECIKRVCGLRGQACLSAILR